MTIDIKRDRKKAKLSVADLARELGVSDTMIRDMEAGRRNAGLRLLPRLTHAIGTDLERLTHEALASGPVELDISTFPESHGEKVAQVILGALRASLKEIEDAKSKTKGSEKSA